MAINVFCYKIYQLFETNEQKHQNRVIFLSLRGFEDNVLKSRA